MSNFEGFSGTDSRKNWTILQDFQIIISNILHRHVLIRFLTSEFHGILCVFVNFAGFHGFS